MPNSPMSVTFCKYSNFEVHMKEYGCFSFCRVYDCFLGFLEKLRAQSSFVLALENT
jgi:hypothetical protein